MASNNTYPWWLATSVTVNNGSTTVAVNSGEDTSGVFENDALIIYDGELYIAEIRRSLVGTLELKTAWPHPTVTAKGCKVLPTAGDFQAASQALRDATSTLELNFDAIESWGTALGYVTYTSVGGEEFQARTMRQMDADFQALLDEVQPFAISLGEMEAMRNANRDFYAASGFVHFGKQPAEISILKHVNEGLWAYTHTEAVNSLYLGRGGNYVGTDITGTSKTANPVIHIAGFTSELILANDLAAPISSARIALPPAPDGTVTYDSATGVVVQHADATTAFAAETATNKVVTERFDMYGLEYYLELITPSNPQVSPYGCIQSQLTPVDGVATQAATRADTYYHVFTGDTAVASDYREWDWFALSNEDRAKILANPEHHIYYVGDGNWVQWKIRQRSVAGAGNGNWFSIDATTSSTPLGFGETSAQVRPQGVEDVPRDLIRNQYYSSTQGGANILTSLSGNLDVFVPRNHSDAAGIAYNQECYFLVLGTVQRLNQGVYHPSFNPLGTAVTYQNNNPAKGGVFWYQAGSGHLNSTSACFTAGRRYEGDISSGVSGRPEGKYYDAIYASGQGGVIDNRLEAVDNSSNEKASEIESKVKAGTYRGMQKLPWTEFYQSTALSSLTLSNGAFVSDTSLWKVGDIVSVVKDGVVLVESAIIQSVSANASVAWDGDYYGTYNRVSGEVYTLVHTRYLDISVEGNVENGFTVTELIGDPANILAVPDLADGILGYWNPNIPNGIDSTFYLTRKCIQSHGSNMSWQYTTDNGATWASSAVVLVGGTNSFVGTTVATTGNVSVVTYQAAPYQTEESVNADIVNGVKGILGVVACGHNEVIRFALLQESLINKVNVNVATGSNLNPMFSMVNPNLINGHFDTANTRFPEHSPLTLQVPNNSSPSVKAAVYQTEENKGLYLNFAYNEIKHDGTDWGDDSTIKIANGQSTYTNLNGETCLYGTNRLTKRYGWKK